ncbi:MAG: Monosaccharide-transporting ATPase [Cryobacterium sp.]|jgi:ribose transport system permease protein|nr:Monosaccharide-transporting ATPase [Cryobacterium sp.]
MNTTIEALPAVQRRDWKEFASAFLVRHIMVVVMLLIVAFFAYRSARFATPDNLTNILIAAAPFALIALGQTLVILTGGIDLSVGSVMAASAMAAAWTAKNAGDNPLLPLVAAVVTGLLAGSINGLIVSKFEVPPFITTLGMLTLASGIAYVIGNGAPINGLPASFGTFANTQILGLTLPVILMILAILVLAFVMKRTNYGLRVYAIGGNRLAAEIAGVRSRNILFSVYAISGVLAGLSGLMLASRVITGAPNLGQGYELDAIAAVVIGGASLMGGRGTIWGTAIGLLLIQTINNGLDLLLVPAYWQNVIKGVIIVAAVGVDVWAARRGSR